MKEKKKTKPFVHLPHAREEEQKEVMNRILAAGECPFCVDNLFKYHKRPIVRMSSSWLLTENQWPYKHTKLHLLLISTVHQEKLSELSQIARLEFWEMITWAEAAYDIKSGGLGLRFGDPKDNGGTVRHLHAHLIVPDKKRADYESPRFKIG